MKKIFSLLVFVAVATFVFAQDTTNDSWTSSGGTVSTGESALVQTTGTTARFTVNRTDGVFLNILAGSAGGSFYFPETARFSFSPGTNLTDFIPDVPNAMFIYGGSHPTYPGQVAIGTDAPGDNAKLTVNGTVRCEEAKVVLNVAAPDYVFEPAYQLMPLAEVEAYINENKHLPEIPSAAEFAADGVKLGQMSFDLLKKVEELTLYMIELKKENESLKARVAELEQK